MGLMLGIIYNPISHMGASVPKIKAFLKKLDEAGIEYDCRPTKKAGDAGPLALELAETCDTVVAAGGDGTVYEIINAVWDKDVTLGIIPCGSGNDIARGLYNGVPNDKKTIEILMSDKTVQVDCARVNDQYTMMLIGGFGDTAIVLEKYLQNGGSYARAVPSLLFHNNAKKYTVKINNKVRIYETEFITVINPKAAGGGMTIYKDADMTDGKMELVALNKKTRIRRFRNFLSLALGRLDTQLNIDIISFDECTIIPEAVSLCNLDGELVRFEEFHVKVLPGKLRFKTL